MGPAFFRGPMAIVYCNCCLAKDNTIHVEIICEGVPNISVAYCNCCLAKDITEFMRK